MADGRSQDVRPSPPESEHLGRQVVVTLAYHDEDVSGAPVVAEGLFLAFGEYGEVVIQAEDGRLQFCWPMLRVEPAAASGRPHAAGCLGRHVGADDEWCYTSARGDTSLRPPTVVFGRERR